VRTFVIGDIHGAHKALRQCWERSGFDRSSDRLIVLGDVCDVYPEVKECLAELLTLAHCDYVLGNHDVWAMEWSLRGVKPSMWLKQGGEATVCSYEDSPMPREHFEFLDRARLWIELGGKVFVHAGFDPNVPLGEQGMRTLTTDRTLVERAWQEHSSGRARKLGIYEDIFLGHTPTQMFGSDVPLHLGNVWMLDTGAGWSGKLTMMDVDTKQFWQSDTVTDLYGPVGRGGKV
jgi:serine/threonine protein phosphatase 1